MALSVTFSPNGNLVSTACLDATNSCRIYNVGVETNPSTDDSKNNTFEEVLTKAQRSIDHSEGMVISHPFLTNSTILTATQNIVYEYDIEKSAPNGIFDNRKHNGHSAKTEISTLATMNNCSNNSEQKLFLSGDDTGTIKLWDIRNSPKNSCVMSWYKSGYFETEISCMEFFPNNECFIAGSKDGSLRLIDIRENYKQLNSYQSWYQYKKNKKIPLTALKFSKTGRFVFAGMLFYLSIYLFIYLFICPFTYFVSYLRPFSSLSVMYLVWFLAKIFSCILIIVLILLLSFGLTRISGHVP